MERGEMMALAMVSVGFLSVDQQGRVWRHRRVFGEHETIISPVRADTGVSKDYLRVQFTVGGERHLCYAHRLVWMVVNQRLIPSPMEVNHKNGNRRQNRPSNLELTLRPHNTAHGLHALGGMQRRKHPGAKLTPEQVIEIDRLCREKAMSKVAIAELFKVTTKTVRNIATRVKWQELFRD